MSDTDKKTLRHFYCRDSLWGSFERMSEDFDRGMDDLINEAMGFLAREKGFMATESQAPSRPTAHGVPARAPAPSAVPPPPLPQMPAHGEATPQRASAPTVPPPLPPPRNTAQPPAVPQPGAAVTPPLPPGGAQTPAPPLFLIFDSKKYRIDKEQFIIGRGVKSSDLPIRDGNISRKHCAVIRRNGAYFIKDLGSTNGIDFNGNRIDNRRIEEGDVFFLCEYQLRFTFS